MGTLILTVTRACNLRCSYCPTAKDGWPSLTTTDAAQAVALFADRYGGGEMKLFGGEPLLVPSVVRAAMEAARGRPEVTRVYLSTNGLGLDREWLEYLRDYPKGILTISLDGRPGDHRRLRRGLTGVADSYDHVVSLLPALLATPRVVITQTIAPATANHGAENFNHLLSLGFWRFNFLPGYYIPWKEAQLDALEAALRGIEAVIRTRWERDERIYIRNLFTMAPTPFFNSGIVVDADRTIHPSNVGLSGSLEGLLGHTRVGDLDMPPTPEAVAARSREVNGLLQRHLPTPVWQATQRVDSMLTAFCHRLYPAYFAYRRRRREAARSAA